MKKDKYEEMAYNHLMNLNNIFRNEDEKEPVMTVDIEDVNEEFFTAQLLATFMQFQLLTDNDVDLIGFIGILNKLAVQYLVGQVEE